MKNLSSLIKAILVSIVFFYAQPVFAQDFDYLPAKIDGHQILDYEHFVISYNEEHEQADWVAYELTKAEVDLDGDRCKGCFDTDDSVTTGSAVAGDYSSTGFDRGHLAPSADFYQSPAVNKSTFLFSNMSPQSPGLNREVWADLEGWVRDKASEYGKLYVITGPVFKDNLGKIGNNEVSIPGYFYKVLLRFNEDGNAKTIGFILPNLGANGHFKDYTVPVNLVETLTGLDFFPALPSSVENKNESQYELKYWGLED
ncbi:MAG: DNA/RNA non-specific endonuclease [Cyclobacteriaceae bacterium]